VGRADRRGGGAGVSIEDPRSGCRGLTPLDARLEDWQIEICRQPDLLTRWCDEHGSPINLIHPGEMERNAGELIDAASGHGIDLRIFFARKANKALALVDQARRLGLGVDLAGERELEQVLRRGVEPQDLVMSAAIKPVSLLRLCATTGTTVAIDNEDELQRLAELVESGPGTVPIAIRLAPTPVADGTPTRFGIGLEEALAMVDRHWTGGDSRIRIAGVHFHLDGYDPDDRVAAIGESLELIDALRGRGHEVGFLDIGGGIPIRYLDSGEQWTRFWAEQRRALGGKRPELTFGNRGLGLIAGGRGVRGEPNVYPFHQETVRGGWLDRVLGSPLETGSGADTVAGAIASLGLELRCEPGRSLLDGCGMTVARVEFRKQRGDGTWLIGLGMNRTQCRSSSDDFLVDPLLIRAEPSLPGAGSSGSTGPIQAYLVGAYCMERELLTWRKLEFPAGVSVGDLVAFPNTAGYLMHILESSSHQIPLARNLVVDGERAELDPIDGDVRSDGEPWPAARRTRSSRSTVP
jgi:diaminopimelate decarboxylase